DRLPRRQDQESAAGLVRLDEHLPGGCVELTRLRRDEVEHVVGKRREHRYPAQLTDPVPVAHPGTSTRRSREVSSVHTRATRYTSVRSIARSRSSARAARRGSAMYASSAASDGNSSR